MHIIAICYGYGVTIMASAELMNNGNDPPRQTPNLEFSDEKGSH